MKILRYDINSAEVNPNIDALVEAKSGDYVFYDDVSDELKKLTSALLALKEEFTGEYSNYYRGCGYDGCEIELSDVLNIIDNALGEE